MATKRDEQIAWKKLGKAFPGKFRSLELEYAAHSDSEETVLYQAYVESSHLSAKFPTPMEAVNELIKKFGGE